MKSLKREWLFTDETQEFRNPPEPLFQDEVVFSIRTAKDNADSVWYLEGEQTAIEMQKVKQDDIFDYYQHKTLVKERVHYCFKITAGEDTCYYNRMGPCDNRDNMFDFRIVPDYVVPEWLKGAVIYQIYPDRFLNGDLKNDVLDREYLYLGNPVTKITDWNQYPQSIDVGNFYGGDIQGIWDKLDYIQDLGVDVIYLNPVFVSPSNHKYDCQDYDHIDPHYGVIIEDGGESLQEGCGDNMSASRYRLRTTFEGNLEASDRFFAGFIEEIHRRGMKIILDGVFNHCGSFHKWLDAERIYEKNQSYQPGAFLSQESPYQNFFHFQDMGQWPYNDSYDGWWGHKTLPKLNYEGSSQLYEQILRIAQKWVSPPFCADGWRLDVAADLGNSPEFNHQFWRDFRIAVKQANPEAVILAEHYGDPSAWMEGDQWDTIMNYDAFMEPVSWFLTGMEKHSDAQDDRLYGDGECFFRSMKYHMSRLMTNSLYSAMNELSNHDHSRFLTRTNRTVGRTDSMGPQAAEQNLNYGIFRAGVLIQMTWPGAPAIYYGDEAGVCGWTDPDNRRTYPWGRENMELIEFHKYMTRLHHQIPALMKGSWKPLLAEQNLIAYARFFKQSVCIVAVSTDSKQKNIRVPVGQLGVKDSDVVIQCMLTSENGYNAGRIPHDIYEGVLSFQLNAFEGILLEVKKTLDF